MHGHAQGQALSIGFVCSVCLSIFAKFDFSLCPMCESKVAIDRSAGAPPCKSKRTKKILPGPSWAMCLRGYSGDELRSPVRQSPNRT